MVLTVCMSPSIDVNVELDTLNVGQTNVVKSKEISFGGKALNVAIGVKRLGGEVYTTGLMYDENGSILENALEKEGVDFGFVWCKGRVRENYKFIDQRAMLTEVNDVGEEVEKERLLDVLERVKLLSKKSSVTVISGGLPRGVDPKFYGELFRAVAPNSIRIVDASGERMISALKEGVDLVKPNIQELENTLGVKVTDKNILIKCCKELIALGAKKVLLSLGADGAVITDGNKFYHCKSINVAVNSTVGAGDAMVAAVALKLKKKASLPEILRAGVAAGTARIATLEKISFSKEKCSDIYKKIKVTEFFE